MHALVFLIASLAAARQPQPAPATAVFAGGCFWGVEAVFEHLRGVTSATAGYARGAGIPVTAGWDGRVEAVRVGYDPALVSYRELLQVFFSIAHDPTTRDRQGPDAGPEYRALVLYLGMDQKRLAEAYMVELSRAGSFTRPIVTEIRSLGGFDVAEPFHQDYAVRHPSDPYIVANDAPKLARLRQTFPGLYRDQQQQPRPLVDYPLKLVRLTFQADSIAGLQILAQPATKSLQGRKEGDLVWLRFDPEAALSWLNSAASVLRTPVPGGPADAIQWSPTLHPLDGRGGFLLGRHRKKGVLARDYWLAIADSAPGWQAEIAAAEADSLLRIILSLASQARIDTASVADPGHADRPAVTPPAPVLRGPSGRAAVQFIVGADGRPEPASIDVLTASSARHAAFARELVLGLRYDPAVRGGNPVRQLVRRVLVWR